MRLWHRKLIPYLPRQQILGQHRECCALRGKGWGRKHSTVDYVFEYDPVVLYFYHLIVMLEMESRGYKVEENWFKMSYRGKALGFDSAWLFHANNGGSGFTFTKHDDNYLRECLDNLKGKGVIISEEIFNLGGGK